MITISVLFSKMTEINAEIKGSKCEETAMQRMILILMSMIKDQPSVDSTLILTTRVKYKTQVNKRPGNNTMTPMEGLKSNKILERDKLSH